MREIQELTAEPRAGTGKGPAFRTRQKGLIPAIIYGGEARARADRAGQPYAGDATRTRARS